MAQGAGERVGQGSGKAAPPTAVIDHATRDGPVVRVWGAEEWVKSAMFFDTIPSRWHR